MNGIIKVKYKYSDDSYPPEKPILYKKSDIDDFIEKIKSRETFYYGKTDLCLYQALEKYSIKDKEVAIMGSACPWYESICLFFGGKPTTIEYNKLISEDPRLKVITYNDCFQSARRFDIAFSISSFEHDGLGRYGDFLNPNGDLDAMRKMKTILKPRGLLFLAVPIDADDAIVWNLHRVYGRKRLPLLLIGWRLIETIGFRDRDVQQPIFVLENDDSKGRKLFFVMCWLFLRKLKKLVKAITKRVFQVLYKFKKRIY